MELIRKLQVFGPLSDEEQFALRNTFSRGTRVAPGRSLLRAGDPARHYAYAVDGWLSLQRTLPSGVTGILALYLPGDFVDLEGVRAGEHEYDVVALTSSRVMTAPVAEVRALRSRYPGVRAAMNLYEQHTASIMRQWLLGVGHRPAIARLAHLYCEVFTRLKAVGGARLSGCRFPMTQSALSGALGMSTVHVNRVSQHLRHDNIAHKTQTDLQIFDLPALMTLAGFDSAYLRQGAAQVSVTA